jgi:hypothetical protein
LGIRDESDQRGDTVHVGTVVKRRIGLLRDPQSPRRDCIPIGWKLFSPVRRRSTSLGNSRPNILIALL